MKNDAGWQRRSDNWVNASHKSRLRKEKALQDKNNRDEVKRDKKSKGADRK